MEERDPALPEPERAGPPGPGGKYAERTRRHRAGLPGIASFAKGLEQDLDTVTNGLTMNCGSGPAEGRVSHF